MNKDNNYSDSGADKNHMKYWLLEEMTKCAEKMNTVERIDSYTLEFTSEFLSLYIRMTTLRECLAEWEKYNG